MSANFRRKEAPPTNHCWCKKTRAIALSCGIKICTGGFITKHACDGQTDGQNYDSQDRASVAAGAVKIAVTDVTDLLRPTVASVTFSAHVAVA